MSDRRNQPAWAETAGDAPEAPHERVATEDSRDSAGAPPDTGRSLAGPVLPRSGPPVPSPERDPDGGASLPAPAQEASKPLSMWVKPMVWLHRLFRGDKKQHREWRERITAIEQAADIDREASTEGKAILADRKAWRQMKITGLVGASGGLALGSVWMSWLIPVYAFGWGYGWWAAAYLLPVPIAWSLGRRLWERAALQGMKDLGTNPTPQQQLRTLSAGMLRGMAAGAGMGFALVFLQGLISYTMTPAATIFHEVIIDLVHGSMGAALGATVGAVFGPLVGRPAPDAAPRIEGAPLLTEPD